jgi:hypothetical protein
MKVSIDEAVCLKKGLTVQEVMIALAMRTGEWEEDISNMLAREILVERGGNYVVTQHWSDVIDEILCDSSGEVQDEERLLNLATKMRACFPEGKMKDSLGRVTPYYYRCNNPEVIKKLKKFFMLFGDYSDDELIDAARRYVASFNGNYKGMRLIKYFILKDAIKQGEEGNHVEQVSDLLTFLENKEEDTGVVMSSDDWLMSARN